MLYFDHDTDASKSDEINDLRCLCGGAAVDAYWYILEQIYREETHWVFSRNQRVNPSVLRFFAVDEETFGSWIATMCDLGMLFSIVDNDGVPNAVMSARAAARIEKYKSRAETARQNGKNGGRPPKENPGKTQSVSKSKPKANQAKPTSKAKKREEKRRHGFSQEENPMSGKGGGGVENRSPVCPDCGGPMRPDSDVGGWRCRDGSCRAAVKFREAHRHGMAAYCPRCGVEAKRNTQSGRFECPGCLDVYGPEDVVWRR